MKRWLLLVALLLVAAPSFAQPATSGKRLCTDYSCLQNDPYGWLQFDINAGTGADQVMGPNGWFMLRGCLTIGSSDLLAPGTNGTCICRDGADRLWEDKNCNASKDNIGGAGAADDQYIDNVGGSGSGTDVSVAGGSVLSAANFGNGSQITWSGTAPNFTPVIPSTFNTANITKLQLDIDNANTAGASLCLKTAASGSRMTFGSCGGGTSNNFIDSSSINFTVNVPAAGDVTAGIPTDGISLAMMQDNSVGNSNLTDNAVDSAEIVSGAIKAAKIDPGALQTDSLYSNKNWALPNSISPPLVLSAGSILLRSQILASTITRSAMDTTHEQVLNIVETRDWATAFNPGTGECDTGALENQAVHLYNAGSVSGCSGPTAGPFTTSILCSCSQTTFGQNYGPSYGPPNNAGIYVPGHPRYWAYNYSGYAATNAVTPYLYGVDQDIYPNPVIRFDVGDGSTASGCLAGWEIDDRPALWPNKDIVIHIKVYLNNPTNSYTITRTRNLSGVAFWGWQQDFTDQKAGQTLILNEAATTPSAALNTTDNHDTVGVLWWGPTRTFYSVWILSGSSHLYIIKQFNSTEFDNFESTTGDATFNVVMAFDTANGGPKSVAWTQGSEENGTWAAATETPLLGSPSAGGFGYRRVAAICKLSAQPAVTNMHMMIQRMDLIQ